MASSVQQSSQWAASTFRTVGANALGLWPVVLVVVGLGVVHDAVFGLAGLPAAGQHFRDAVGGVGRLSNADAMLLTSAAVADAILTAIAIVVGLAMFDRDGHARPWRVGIEQTKGRLVAAVGAGAGITILWGVPAMLAMTSNGG